MEVEDVHVVDYHIHTHTYTHTPHVQVRAGECAGRSSEAQSAPVTNWMFVSLSSAGMLLLLCCVDTTTTTTAVARQPIIALAHLLSGTGGCTCVGASISGFQASAI